MKIRAGMLASFYHGLRENTTKKAAFRKKDPLRHDCARGERRYQASANADGMMNLVCFRGGESTERKNANAHCPYYNNKCLRMQGKTVPVVDFCIQAQDDWRFEGKHR
jgi:hypothetical protein